MVKLTSSDGQEFTIEKEIANQSVLIKNMLEDIGDADDQPIPLPNVSGAILKKGMYCFTYTYKHVVCKRKDSSEERVYVCDWPIETHKKQT
jgi:hypothetical protein